MTTTRHPGPIERELERRLDEEDQAREIDRAVREEVARLCRER